MLENPNDDTSKQFRINNRKKLYKGGKLGCPYYCLGEVNDQTVLCRIMYTRQRVESRRVLSHSQACDVVMKLHKDSDGKTCKPGGINALVSLFTMTYYYKGIRSVVTKVLKECCGTCKLSKRIETKPPPPKAIRTMGVMEVVQCDLIFISTSKCLPTSNKHDYKYILSVKDCFSKYCWLFPLTNKKALPIAQALKSIFVQYGSPKYLHTDNGTEFCNDTIKILCKDMGISIKHGRPYHPQSQGQIEVLNKRIKSTLSHFLQRYHQSIQHDIWPYILNDVSTHINYTWHQTIRNTPFNVLMGRHSRIDIAPGVNDLSEECDEACMAEDFLIICDTQTTTVTDPFHVEISVGDIDMPLSVADAKSYNLTLPNEYQLNCDLQSIAQLENTRSLINKNVFEATEATIRKNRRAHLPKIKHPVFNVGEEVLFRNPNKQMSGLAATMNIRGIVTERVSKNVYQVKQKFDTESDDSDKDTLYVLYSTEMVHAKDVSPIPKRTPVSCDDVTADSESANESLNEFEILNKIREFADMCREDVVKKSFGCTAKINHSLQELLDNVGIKANTHNADDLMVLFYLSMDCFFIYTLTNDNEYKLRCASYASLLAKVLKENNFNIYLSGIYFWEAIRCSKRKQILHSLTHKYIPIFHNCSDCLNTSSCKHPCCRNWFVSTGIQLGLLKEGISELIVTQAESHNKDKHPGQSRHGSAPPSYNVINTDHHSVKIESALRMPEYKKCVQERKGKQAHHDKRSKLSPKHPVKSTSMSPFSSRKKLVRMATLKMKQHSTSNTVSSPYRFIVCKGKKYLDTLLSSISENILQGNTFAKDILESVCMMARETLAEKVYKCLSSQERTNLSQNLTYVRDVIGKPSKGSNLITTTTNQFMQKQGSSALCGLCTLNNLLGKEEFQSKDLDEIADNMWFQQIHNGLLLTDEMQFTRLKNGYYCIEVLQYALEKKGFTANFIPVTSVQNECLKATSLPTKLLLCNANEHYVAVYIYSDHAIMLRVMIMKQWNKNQLQQKVRQLMIHYIVKTRLVN